MGEEGDSGGLVSKDQLEQLVRLFDRFEYAQDPTSRDAKEAESEYYDLVDALNMTVGSSVPPAQFQAFVRRHCRAIIAKEVNKPTTLPPSA
jgi:hypothetical protein